MGLKQNLATFGLATTVALSSQGAKATPAQNDTPSEQPKAVLHVSPEQMAEAAQHEIVKNMKFPDIFPVTKDGQFDETEALKWIKDFSVDDNIPHLKEYMQNLHRGVSVEKAYGILVERLAAGDKAKEEQLSQLLPFAEKALNDVEKKTTKTSRDFGIASGLFALTALYLLVRSQAKESLGSFMGSIVAVSVSMACALQQGSAEYMVVPKNMEKLLLQEHRALYDNYVRQQVLADKNAMFIFDSQGKIQDVLYRLPKPMLPVNPNVGSTR